MSENHPNRGSEIIDLEEVDFTPELWSCIPAAVARKFKVLPVAQKGKCLVIAVAHAANLHPIDQLHGALDRKFEVLDIRIAGEAQIDAYIEEIYGE